MNSGESSEFDVVVIGGGPAGVTAALRARELGAEVALIERSRLGGTCTNDGCVPTRVLAKAARLIREADHFDEYGLVGPLPQLDVVQLMARARETVEQVHNKKQLIAHLEGAGVELYAPAGDARFVDAHRVLLGDGSYVRGRGFIICAGGRARHLPIPGAELAISHADLWSLEALPGSMAIVGGAATGSQIASIMDAFGVHVTLLERGGRILQREDALVSQVMTQEFVARGMDVIDGIESVDRIEKVPGGLRLVYLRDGRAAELDADAVLIAAGWPGNGDQLGLEAAGVRHEHGYVLVDDYLRTSQPHIFAAGDINGRVMLVQSAGYEARVAAENAVLGVGQPCRHQVVPHGGFTDPEYASVGLTEQEVAGRGEAAEVAVVRYADLDRAVIDGRTDGFCKLIASRENHRLLGAHIVGEQALEAIQLVAAGMSAGMWVEQLAELELAYPTYTAIVGLAARQLVRQLGVMPLTPEWRALGREHAEWERSRVEPDENPVPALRFSRERSQK
jgi:pyruvate/2-oxoglutarate dehydrogenase complex dihydrolipoamide dehydrogenase (E3) component